MNEVVTDAAGHVYVDTESSPGQITMEIGHGDYAGPSWMEPAHARALAAVLLRAADEVEGRGAHRGGARMKSIATMTVVTWTIVAVSGVLMVAGNPTAINPMIGVSIPAVMFSVMLWQSVRGQREN